MGPWRLGPVLHPIRPPLAILLAPPLPFPRPSPLLPSFPQSQGPPWREQQRGTKTLGALWVCCVVAQGKGPCDPQHAREGPPAPPEGKPTWGQNQGGRRRPSSERHAAGGRGAEATLKGPGGLRTEGLPRRRESEEEEVKLHSVKFQRKNGQPNQSSASGGSAKFAPSNINCPISAAPTFETHGKCTGKILQRL